MRLKIPLSVTMCIIYFFVLSYGCGNDSNDSAVNDNDNIIAEITSADGSTVSEMSLNLENVYDLNLAAKTEINEIGTDVDFIVRSDIALDKGQNGPFIVIFQYFSTGGIEYPFMHISTIGENSGAGVHFNEETLISGEVYAFLVKNGSPQSDYTVDITVLINGNPISTIVVDSELHSLPEQLSVSGFQNTALSFTGETFNYNHEFYCDVVDPSLMPVLIWWVDKNTELPTFDHRAYWDDYYNEYCGIYFHNAPQINTDTKILFFLVYIP